MIHCEGKCLYEKKNVKIPKDTTGLFHIWKFMVKQQSQCQNLYTSLLKNRQISIHVLNLETN